MYTIQILKSKLHHNDLGVALQKRFTHDGRFRVRDVMLGQTHSLRQDYPQVGKTMLPTIFLQYVRLTEKKPYCGNHPGPCEVNPFRPQEKKKTTSYLEWDDWVAFHTLVNGLLNQRRVSANIWTLPQDVKGKFWIRKGRQARLHYDYSEQDYHGRIIRVWNSGTDDQFQG